MVVRETQPPISTEFQRVIREVNLGLPFEQALNNMVRRVRSDDLELMATAINIQHQVGGNLAEILDSIAFTIRERIRIKGEIRVLTAQQRLSGYVVAGLPIFLVVILSIIAPKFMEPMFYNPPDDRRAPARRDHAGHRRRDDAHGLHDHPPHRRHRGLGMGLPLLMAILAAGGVLLVTGRSSGAQSVRPGPGPPDPAGLARGRTQPRGARAARSRSSTARCARSCAGCPASAHASPRGSASGAPKSDWPRPAIPYGMRTVDFLGLKVVVALVRPPASCFLLFGVALGQPEHRASSSALGGLILGFFMPDYWLSWRIRKRQKAILLAIPDSLDLLDDLGQGRPRLRRRARQGRREDERAARR